MKKELREWLILIAIGGVIYLFGWHTAIIGKVQQLFLSSGIIQPSEVTEDVSASYDFILEGIDGNVLNAATLRGEVVFLNFWATWCPPCIAEMPDIHNLYEEKGKEVKFIMISLDRDREKAKAFIKKKSYDFPVYFLQSNLPQPYNIHAIPTTYLLSRDGKIKIENQGMAKYNTKKFKELLAGLITSP